MSVQPWGVASFLSDECGWRGSAATLDQIVQWLAAQEITARQDLNGFSYEHFVNPEQWPDEVMVAVPNSIE